MMLEAWAVFLAVGVAGNLYVEEPGVREFSGQMIVRPTETLRGESIDLRERRAAENALRPYLIRYVPSTDEFIVRVPSGKSENSFSAELMATGRFSYAEPDWRVYPAATPNDPKWAPTTNPAFPGQWYHNTLNTNYAWNYLGAGAPVIIAVVDTGIDATHPDLSGVCLPGRNVVPGTPDAHDTSDASTFGHGTFVAGIIAANPNNGLDVCGMGWNGVGSGSTGNLFRILPVRVSNEPDGSTQLSTILAGLQWAAQSGAKVVNTSYSGFDSSSVGTTGSYLRGLGAFSIWAAGNDILNKSNPAYDHKDVIVVGGSEVDDSRWSGSNYGLCIDFFAPATQITSLKQGSGTKTPTGGGTSFSAAIVSGIVAQIVSRAPSLGWADVERRLKYGCFDMMDNRIPGNSGYLPGNDVKYGWGRVNSAKSVIWPYDVSLFPIQFQLVQLNLPSGYTAGAVYDINDRGEMAGAVFDTGNVSRAAFWSSYSEPPILANTSSGLQHSEFTAINDLGVCLMRSWSGLRPQQSNRISTWTRTGGRVDLAPNSYAPYSQGIGSDINNASLIVGTVTDLPNSHIEAATWAGGSLFRIGPLVGTDGDSFGTAVNNHDLVVGRYKSEPSKGFWFDGLNAREFSSHSFGFPEPLDINDQALAVGVLRNWDDSTTRAFLFDINSNTYVWTMSPLPPNPGEPACTSIDEWERIIGTAGSVQEPYLYDGPLVGKLFPLCASGTLFTRLTDATAISNAGQIVGSGLINGVQKPFVALPLADRNLELAYNMGQDELAASGGPVYLGALPPALRVQFRTASGGEFPGNPTVLATYHRATGRIFLENLPSGINAPFRVYVKIDNQVPGYSGPGYLGQLNPPMSQPAFALDIRSAELVNLMQGDCDMDNEIGIGDYAILSNLYGSEDGDGRYQPTGDINGDTVIDIADYAVLSANYGLVGD